MTPLWITVGPWIANILLIFVFLMFVLTGCVIGGVVYSIAFDGLKLWMDRKWKERK